MNSTSIHLLYLLSMILIVGCKNPESSSKKSETVVTTPIHDSKDEVGEIKTTSMFRYVSFPDGFLSRTMYRLKKNLNPFCLQPGKILIRSLALAKLLPTIRL